jgi:hypothetical protein
MTKRVTDRSPVVTSVVVLAFAMYATILSPPVVHAQTVAACATTSKAKWGTLASSPVCSANPKTADCAAAAIAEASSQCAASATYFKKATKTWQIVGFSLLIVAAVTTALGASATLANAKVYSTLGATTGIGAAALEALNKYVTGTPPPSADQIYETAPIYAAQCVAAAAASPNSK